MNTIFMSTMQKLSHAAEAITGLENSFNKTTQEHDGRGTVVNLSSKVFSKTVSEDALDPPEIFCTKKILMYQKKVAIPSAADLQVSRL